MKKMDELLFSVCVIETGNWYILMGEMDKILKHGPNSGEQISGGRAETGPAAGRKPQPRQLVMFVWLPLTSEGVSVQQS